MYENILGICILVSITKPTQQPGSFQVNNISAIFMPKSVKGGDWMGLWINVLITTRGKGK